MTIGKWRANSWFFVYIAMFIPFGFVLDNWFMAMPGLIFALLFGVEPHQAASDRRADQYGEHGEDS